MKKMSKATRLPKPTKGMKVVVQVLTVGGWWETHLAWVTAMLEGPTGEVEAVALETTEGKKMQHPWAQTWWSRAEAVQE